MKSVETYWEPDYQAWIDYRIEQAYEDSLKQFRFFFHDPKTNGLLGYMSVNVHLDETAHKGKYRRTAYIIDTCAASTFETYLPRMQKEFFLQNGYIPWIHLKWFWRTMFIHTLAFVRKKFPECEIVLVNALPRNEAQVWKLIEKVKNTTVDLIEGVYGWNEMNMATLFLHTGTKND